MNKAQDLMKRFTQFVATTLLAAGFSFVGAGCQGGGPEAESATTMPDQPKGEHPKGEHPSGEHPSGEHPSGDHPK
jgi:hypothetical protein